jgi:hypothetical protein
MVISMTLKTYKNKVAILKSQSGGGKKPPVKAFEERVWLREFQSLNWLLNGIYEDKWVLSNGPAREPTTVNWASMMPDGSRLSDTQNQCLLETIQLITIQIRVGHNRRTDSGDYQKDVADCFIHLAHWMKLKGISKFAKLSKSHLRTFQKECVFGYFNLIDGEKRFFDYIERKRSRKEGFPLLNENRYDKTIRRKKLAEEMGVDESRVNNSPLWNFYVALLCAEEDLYIKPHQEKYLEMDEPPEEKVRCHLTIWSYLYSWQLLWDYRLKLPNSINFNPFPKKGIDVVAKELGTETRRTPTIPWKQGGFLIDRAIRWVVHYADDLLLLRDKYEEIESKSLSYKARKKALDKLFDEHSFKSFSGDKKRFPGAPWPIRPNKTEQNLKEGDLAFGIVLLKLLPIACFIVIAAFTARRLGEIQSSRANTPAAIERDARGWWFWCWIEKTVQDWDRTPCTEVVAKAVEVLYQLSKPARDITQKPELFQFKYLGRDEVNKFNVHEAMRLFVEYVEVPPLADGSFWHFAAHQFRRFFSKLYLHRYEYGDLDALSWHLRHAVMEMTEIYATEVAPGKDAAESPVEDEDLMMDVALGLQQLSGKGGEVITRLAEWATKMAKREIEVPSKRQLRRFFGRIMNKVGLKTIPFPWGRCCVFEKHIKFNGRCCEDGAEKPDLTNATPLVCKSCTHFSVNDDHAPFWKATSNRWMAVLEQDDTSHLAPNLMDEVKIKANVYNDYYQTMFQNVNA